MISLIRYILSFIVPKRTIRQNIHGLPLPRVCHLELLAADIADRPVFVVGDVHGCLEELCELMDAARALEPNVMFLFVGDLVNRGPNSVGVVRKLRSMAPGQVYAVRGNHDETVLRSIRNTREIYDWVLSDKYKWAYDLDDADIEYLSQLPYTITIPSLDAIIVHAGLVPGLPLELQVLNDLTNMRNIIYKGDPFDNGGLIGTNKHEEGEAWVNLWPGPMHVYFGHDARRKLQRSAYATGLDTGCCHGGELTGVFINGPRKFLSVPSKQPRAHDYN